MGSPDKATDPNSVEGSCNYSTNENFPRRSSLSESREANVSGSNVNAFVLKPESVHSSPPSISRYSSNSSLDSTSIPLNRPCVGSWLPPCPQQYENGKNFNYSNTIQTILHRPPIAPDIVASNIQKNIEHCKQQQRQQIENVIRNNNEASQFLARGNLILRMRGLPYDCSAKQVVDFFESGDEGVSLVENEEGVLFVRKPDGRATGDAFVMLGSEEDINLAMKKHKKSIGSRYIELFRSSSGEVINRSMNTNEQTQPQQPQPAPTLPLIPTIPPLVTQLMTPQGMVKDCIRLRGLPFEAQIEQVLEFLGDFARTIKFRGVHMVYTTDGQPSGEAFIQMTSEHAAWTAATHRHNKYMISGKKNRYIEVFQCSTSDMNYALSSGLPSSPQTPATPVTPRSMIPTPTGTSLFSPYGTAYPLSTPAAVLSHTLAAAHRIAPYPAQIAPAPPPYHNPPLFYWHYPSPPVSPTATTYYSPIAPQIIPGECIPIHHSPEIPLHHHPHVHHPGEAVATM